MVEKYIDAYPHLFKPIKFDKIQMEFALYTPENAPAVEMIANVNIVPFIGDKIVVLETDTGHSEIPGGTREPDEPYMETLRRELKEEAGARLIENTFTVFGFWRCYSSHPLPYRPHLPHPYFIRLVGYGEVAITDVPTNPLDGEQIVKVETLPLQTARERFVQKERADIADLCLLAAHLRQLARSER